MLVMSVYEKFGPVIFILYPLEPRLVGILGTALMTILLLFIIVSDIFQYIVI